MGDLYVLFIGGLPYLVTWMPNLGFRICVKAWRLPTEPMLLIPELGAQAKIVAAGADGLAYVQWDYSDSLQCSVRTPWPREPDVTVFLAIPMPPQPKTGLIYSMMRWISPSHGAHRGVRFNAGTSGWEYVRNLLLATNGFPTLDVPGALGPETVEVRRGS